MMNRLVQLLFVFFIFPAVGSSQDLTAYQKKYFVEVSDTLPYRILLPVNFDASRKYPLIMFLHGAGERGNDNYLQLTHGGKLFLRDDIRKQFPAIVVFPQCKAGSWWSNVQRGRDTVKNVNTFGFQHGGEPTAPMTMLIKLVAQLQSDYRIDKHRMYVGGLSMGGMGTFELVSRMPRTFAAAFPICGGDNPADAPAMRKTAWWIFHGDADMTVPLGCSQVMADALKQQRKTEVKFTVYPGVGHNSWDNAFAEPELLPWLFSHKK